MNFRKCLVTGLGVGICIILGAWVLIQSTPAWAADETCVNGNPAPCEEDIQLVGCTLCHSIRMIAGNRNGTDRQVWAATGTNRHETAPKRADWTALVQSMIDKGSPAILELTAGYLNTNYCTSCSGPILGSPVVPTATITDTAAVVNWDTSANGFADEATTTVLYYGTNKADVLLGPGCSSCQTATVAGSVTHHVVNLSGLSAFTQYYVVNEATSGLGTTRSTYAIGFRTKRASGGGGGECTPATDPIPARVYLSNQDENNPSIVALDPDTDAVTASIPVNGTPGELVGSPDGSTVFAVAGASVSVIDVESNVELGTLLGVGDTFNQLAVSPDGSRLYLAYRQLVPATLKIKVFDTTDPTTPTLMTTVTSNMFNPCYGALGLAVSPDGTELYMACRIGAAGNPDRFYMIDTATYTPTQTATYPRENSNYMFINALAVSPDGSRVYVARAHSEGSTVEYFNGTTGARQGAIALPANALPRAAVFTPDGTKLYVVDQVLGTHVINPVTNTRTTTLPQTKSRGLDIAMAPNTHAFTTLLFEVHDLNAATNAWAATIPGGSDFNAAYQITATVGRPGTPEVCPPEGGGPIPSLIFLSDAQGTAPGHSNQIAVINPDSNLQVASIPANAEPAESVAHPDGSTVYVMEGKNLSVIDVLGNVELSTLIGVGDIFNQLAISPDGSKLYLAYRQVVPSTLIIKVFDTSDPATPTLSTTISNAMFNPCYGALGLAVSPDGSQLYMACRIGAAGNPDRFYMINTATNTPTQTSTYARENTNYMFINALAVTPDGSKVYLARAHSDGSTVEYFNGATGAHLGSIALPENALPRAAAFTAGGSKLYVVDQVLGTHVINPVTNTRTTTLPQSKSRGLDIAMTADGTHAYTTLLFEIFDLYTPTNSWLATVMGDFNAAYQITISPGHE
jgi:DNA-binding beta-propeller fold protein YncE